MAHVRAGLALVVLAGANLLGCGSPAPTSPPGPAIVDGCIDLGADIQGFAWSPGGQYLSVSTWDGLGDRKSWVLTAGGRLAAEVLTLPSAVLDGIVVGPDGRRAWLEQSRASLDTSLVEDRSLGRRVTPLPGPISALGWTQIGYAFVQRRPVGDAVLVINPDNPAAPTELHTNGGMIERLWISSDARTILLTRPADDGGTQFVIVDPTGGGDLAPASADATGASMFGSRVVYHTLGGEMASVPVRDPGAPSPLSERMTRSGLISDQGVLAMAGWERPGLVCVEDVSSRLR